MADIRCCCWMSTCLHCPSRVAEDQQHHLRFGDAVAVVAQGSLPCAWDPEGGTGWTVMVFMERVSRNNHHRPHWVSIVGSSLTTWSSLQFRTQFPHSIQAFRYRYLTTPPPLQRFHFYDPDRHRIATSEKDSTRIRWNLLPT